MKGRLIKGGSHQSIPADIHIHISRYIHPKGVVICEDNREYLFIYMEAIVNGRVYQNMNRNNHYPTPKETSNMCRKFLLSIVEEKAARQ